MLKKKNPPCRDPMLSAYLFQITRRHVASFRRSNWVRRVLYSREVYVDAFKNDNFNHTFQSNAVQGDDLFMRASFRWGMGVAATLGVLTLLFAFWPAESEKEVSRATVAHLEWEVSLDEKTSVTPDSVFREGQVLQTRSDSHLSIHVGTHRIAMAARSRLKLERLQSRQLRFFLSYGKSTFAISKLKRDEALEVVSARSLFMWWEPSFLLKSRRRLDAFGLQWMQAGSEPHSGTAHGLSTPATVTLSALPKATAPARHLFRSKKREKAVGQRNRLRHRQGTSFRKTSSLIRI